LNDQAAVVSLSCIADDAQGERLDVIWDAELAPMLPNGDVWANVASAGVDDVRTLSIAQRI
jgi:hypothetical protein